MFTNKINIFFSTLNFVLIIVGYQLVTTLFLPSNVDLESVSRTVTIPFRAFALGVIIVVFFLNIRKKTSPYPLPFIVLLIYWFLLILRIVQNNFFSTEFFLKDTEQLWLFIFGICLAGLLSAVKSFDIINYNFALHLILISIAVILLVTLFSNQALIGNSDNELRVDANVALNTISYGNLGTMGVYLSLFYLFQTKRNLVIKILLILLIILSVYSILRSGSRGPLLSLFIVLLFWFFSKGKNFAVGIFIVIFSFLLLYLFREQIISIMGDVSPILENRLRATLEGQSNDGRDVIYSTSWNLFLDHPFFGNQFAIINSAQEYTYSHNLILDALIALGFFGGILIIYLIISAIKAIYFSINSKTPYFWISLILMHQIMVLMVSGAFYEDQILAYLLTLHFMIFKNKFVLWR